MLQNKWHNFHLCLPNLINQSARDMTSLKEVDYPAHRITFSLGVKRLASVHSLPWLLKSAMQNISIIFPEAGIALMLASQLKNKQTNSQLLLVLRIKRHILCDNCQTGSAQINSRYAVGNLARFSVDP
jgi:hypothetical protein